MFSQSFFAPWHIECETATSANANIIPTIPCCSHCTGGVTPQWAGCEASESHCKSYMFTLVTSLGLLIQAFLLTYMYQPPLWIICVLLNSWLWIVNFDQRPVHFPLPVSQVLYWVRAMLETSGQALSLLPTLDTTAQESFHWASQSMDTPGVGVALGGEPQNPLS